MTDTRPAFAHREPLMVPAPDGVDDAISAVMAKHRAELDEALAPFGVHLDDLLQPTWMRIVRMSDVVPPGSWAEDLVDSLTPEEAAAATRALGIEYTIDGADPEHIAQQEALRAGRVQHDSGCEADFGAEGQETPCRCAERAEAISRRFDAAMYGGPRPTDLEGD